MNFYRLTKVFFLLAFTEVMNAQTVELPQSVRKGLIYKKENSFIASLQTNGYYFGYSIGKIEKYYLTRFLNFDIAVLRDAREYKINQSYSTNGFLGNYIYGKQNSVINLHVGRGITRYLSEKSRRKGVAVAVHMEGGALLGLLKPYYIQIKDRIDNSYAILDIKYSDQNKELFLDKDRILGSSGFLKGISELKLNPGGFGRIGISFDPGAYENYVKAIHFGLCVDLYSKRLPILASERNKFLFLNFYLSLQFGKRH